MAQLGAHKRHIRFYYPSIPKEGEAPLPVYLALHGGGWHAGSVSTHDGPCKRLALGSGCVVASLDYRMSPEFPAPAAVEDCIAAFKWIQENAKSFGVDGSRVGLVGDSAGANIVAASALLLCNNKAVDGSEAKPLSKPAALFLIYPSLDLTASSGPSYELYANGFYLRTEAIHHYVKLYLEGDETTPKENLPKGGPLAPTDPRVSPLLAPAEDLENLPPTFISTAGYDPLLSDGEAFFKRLQAAKKEVKYECEEDAIHVWLHLVVQAGDVVLPKTAKLGARMAELIGHK
jgi:acetyl esterase